MKNKLPSDINEIKCLIRGGKELPLAIKSYPSRGQTSIQKLYLTEIGKLFYKETSKRNHQDCQIKKEDGSIAEREFWAFSLAKELGLNVPELRLLNEDTTVQTWLPLPDAHTFLSRQGKLALVSQNIFECAVFDWLTGQIDRHDANFLYDYKDHNIILIDSAHAFLKFEGSLPDYLSYFEIANPKDLKRKIDSRILTNARSLSEKNLKALVPLRSTKEQDMLIKRKLDLKKVSTIQDVLDLYRGVL